eukprot:TRINITY_DN22293_c0_g1_i1.p1 TRINITY_DN22293_c0_g1~~TRINITY_DN22293_c0_g1_i1.p1  ORF type:complete len:300 (-),score=68.68 TRINITY_DN22293_c0_g1_i1:64-888(-)
MVVRCRRLLAPFSFWALSAVQAFVVPKPGQTLKNEGSLQTAVAISELQPQAAVVEAGGSVAGSVAATFGVLAAAAGLARRSRRGGDVSMQGMKDRRKKDFSVKSAMIRKLGKWRLLPEFDMRSQIVEKEDMGKALGKSKEELLADFDRACDFLKTELGCTDQIANISISKVATGLNFQYLGKPNIPSDGHMQTIMDWLCSNLGVEKEDGSLKRVVEQYPFVLGREIPELEESRTFCPEDINFKVAVAEDPALIDKTYNCNGICAAQCVACWYNG